VLPFQGKFAHHTHRLDAGERFNLMKERFLGADDLFRLLDLCRRNRDAEGLDFLSRTKAGSHAVQGLEASNHQPRTDKQDQRQRNLHGDQDVTGTNAALCSE
jgi:hypothetical protein